MDSVTPLFLEDLAPGQRYTTGTLVIDEAAIRTFALAFDPQPFHLDDAAASSTLFGGLAASGWHTAALSMRLLVESGPKLAWGIIGAGCELSWPLPVRPGDTLRVEGEILEVTPSRSRPDRGMITIRNTTLNQQDRAVQIMTGRLVVPRRAGPV
jgi:acyl dehydratase